MPKAPQNYYGCYVKLEMPEPEMRGLGGSNVLVVGDELPLQFNTIITDRGKELPQVAVQLDCGGKQPDIKTLGLLPTAEASQVNWCNANGWQCHAFCSVVGYDQGESTFWVEVALACFAPAAAEAAANYLPRLVARIEKGEHPSMYLTVKEQSQLLTENGNWCAQEAAKLPKLERGNLYFKKKKAASDKAADAAGKHPVGCTVVGYGALAICIYLIYKLVAG